MARSRPGLETAINEILERRGANGRRLSLRQAERLTGLSPATIGELAKGNARTPETLRRFARGLDEDPARLLMLGGFMPDAQDTVAAPFSAPAETEPLHLESVATDEREWLGRFGRALAKMPPGRERELWKDSLRRDVELIESFLERLNAETQRTEGTDSGNSG